MDVWTLPAAIFFGTMGMFAGVAAMYLTGTRVRLLGHQAAEIVLFCLLFAIALFAVIALFQTAPNARRATRPKSELPIGDFHRSLAHRASEKGGLARNRSSSCTRRRAAESRDDLASRLIGHPRYAFGSGVFI